MLNPTHYKYYKYNKYNQYSQYYQYYQYYKYYKVTGKKVFIRFQLSPIKVLT